MAGVLPDGRRPEVTDVVTPEGNGMSSETILFDARWTEDGAAVDRRCVARIEPELDKIPVFPTYDLAMQFDVMSLVADATDVPVPETLWYEADGSIIGAPFFVMGRIDGEVPRDVLPYTFGDNWVDSATPEQRAQLQESAVRAARRHPPDHARDPRPGVAPVRPEGRHRARAPPRRVGGLPRLGGGRQAVAAARRLLRLAARQPAHRHRCPTRLSWGDARIGNMMFADFEVAAVLDWEMAGVAPPEVDLGWMAYLHLFFQDITIDLGLPRASPTSWRPRTWRTATPTPPARRPVTSRWHIAYAAMRHGVDHAPGHRAGRPLRRGHRARRTSTT